MKSKIIVRLLDVPLLTALVFGNGDVRTFVFWIVSAQVLLMFLGWFAVSQSLAPEIVNKNYWLEALAMAVNFAYVCALIYAGFPVLAALYAIAICILRLLCAEKLRKLNDTTI